MKMFFSGLAVATGALWIGSYAGHKFYVDSDSFWPLGPIVLTTVGLIAGGAAMCIAAIDRLVKDLEEKK